jgi:hypothetical protein
MGKERPPSWLLFVSPQEDDWRFSFVKLDYTFEKTDLGFVSERIQLTLARRYSYLVGRNENCHTAQKQFLALLETHETNPTVAQLEAAFSVEKVTREFYDQYKDLFEKTRESLEASLKSAPTIKTHFAERGIECDDFAKKLLGQIVFLYFLQKKVGSASRAASGGAADEKISSATYSPTVPTTPEFPAIADVRPIFLMISLSRFL